MLASVGRTGREEDDAMELLVVAFWDTAMEQWQESVASP